MMDNPTIFIPFGADPRDTFSEVSLFVIRLPQQSENLTLGEDKQPPPPWKTNPALIARRSVEYLGLVGRARGERLLRRFASVTVLYNMSG